MVNRILTRLDLKQVEEYYSAGAWTPDTIYSLFSRSAIAAPNRIAFRETDLSITFEELLKAADGLARYFRKQGLSSGDRVAVWLPNRVEVAAVTLACSREGLICVPSFHRSHTVVQVIALLKQIRAAAFIGESGYGSDSEQYDVFSKLDEISHIKAVLKLDDAAIEYPRFEGLTEHGSQTDIRDNKVNSDAPVYLAFTSGSTGQPKAVLHSSNTLLAPIRAMASDWSIPEGATLYSLSPLSHNLGFGALVMALCLGCTFVAHDLPRSASIAERMLDTKTTFAFGVPTHAVDLLNDLETGRVQALPELIGLRISGATIPANVADKLLSWGIVPQSGYGLTEAGNVHYTRPTDDPGLITGTCGRPFPGHSVRVVDSDDLRRELMPGEIGQILGRGPSLMLGYFDDQLATEETFTDDGWLITGDLGYVDEYGNIKITGRKRDVIIRGGHNIFPAIIEDKAQTAPGVSAAAAIPIPDERLGEKVCIVLKPATSVESIDSNSLFQHLSAAGLSKFDMPEYIATVNDMPLLPSGKIDKRSLLERRDAGVIDVESIRFGSALKLQGKES